MNSTTASQLRVYERLIREHRQMETMLSQLEQSLSGLSRQGVRPGERFLSGYGSGCARDEYSLCLRRVGAFPSGVALSPHGSGA